MTRLQPWKSNYSFHCTEKILEKWVSVMLQVSDLMPNERRVYLNQQDSTDSEFILTLNWPTSPSWNSLCVSETFKAQTFNVVPWCYRRPVCRGTWSPTAWSSCRTPTLCSASGWPYAWVASGRTLNRRAGAESETAHTRSCTPCCRTPFLRWERESNTWWEIQNVGTKMSEIVSVFISSLWLEDPKIFPGWRGYLIPPKSSGPTKSGLFCVSNCIVRKNQRGSVGWRAESGFDQLGEESAWWCRMKESQLKCFTIIRFICTLLASRFIQSCLGS